MPIKSWTPSPSVTYRICSASKAAFARAIRTALPIRNTVTSSSFKMLQMLANGPRLSCSALKKDSFPNLRAPPAPSAS